MRDTWPVDPLLMQDRVQEESCVSSRIGSRSFGDVSVLNPNATAKAGAVPLSHGQLRSGRIEPNALRLPDVRRPHRCAMPGHTTSARSVSILFFGKPCLQSPFRCLSRHAGKGLRQWQGSVEASPPNYTKDFYLRVTARPATSDEVRWILRATPLPPAPRN